jgi:hypothetical protein
MTRKEIEKRIAELEATPRALVRCDEGTHAKPATHRVYEEITGERYGVRSFAGANGTRCTEQEAEEWTAGKLNWFKESQKDIRAAQAELKRLKKELRDAK